MNDLKSRMLKLTVDLARFDGVVNVDGYSNGYADGLFDALMLVKPGGTDYFSKKVLEEALITTGALINHYENYEYSDDEEDESEQRMDVLHTALEVFRRDDFQNTRKLTEIDLNNLLESVRETASLDAIMDTYRSIEGVMGLVEATDNVLELLKSNPGIEEDFLYLRMRSEADKAGQYLKHYFDGLPRELRVEKAE